ncbi:LysR family transcriptional regulator [Tropicibacter naphthalenivorans]|uniref:HTH-type transcriptional regulator YofA n=1 Tax=Tropicibacter naphthalenivorans TaxID=441103 RepID=A0A0P1GM22_9RHOB|nr:LysR family transcriptional regulator [Tropicibacter naphthalenivorans]CUH76432.1 HTH-type transcriptional regulator YofA [Tropicibacter naphthalenivorans]SMC66191.1 DNA-binding transcriptional regulator, LysR family [Tropicibacter naphthalenivorans]
MRNLDLTALRSFVAVAESGGVTRAAGFLNLTQSAVSMQLKRLEELLGQKVLERSGRGVVLTPAGVQLLGYAQRMIELNDEIYTKLTDQSWEGQVVLGVPHDIVYPVIPEVLKRMGRSHPRVQVELISSSSNRLKAQFARGEVDVILTTEADVGNGGETLAEVPLRWVSAPDGIAFKQRPLRLAFCSFCAFRDPATSALDRADVPWEMAVHSDNDQAIDASVSADLAVTASLEGHASGNLVHVDIAALPELGMQKINLYLGSARHPAVHAIADYLRQGFGKLQQAKGAQTPTSGPMQLIG